MFKLSSRTAHNLAIFGLALAGLGIAVLVWCIGHSFWLSAYTQGSMDASVFGRSHTTLSVAADGSSSDLQKAIEAAVDAAIKRDELLLDKLLMVVGLYSTILSVLALVTVYASRQDAKEKITSVDQKIGELVNATKEKLDDVDKKTGELVNDAKEKLSIATSNAEAAMKNANNLLTGVASKTEDLYKQVQGQLQAVNDNARDLAASVEKQLADLRDHAQKDVEALKAQVRAEFPIISQLQSRVLNLMLKLEAKYPEEKNWNRPQPNSWKMEERQQDALIDEAQILALSVVILDEASPLKLYLVLARFYFERFTTGGLTDSDAARVYIYASRAIECDSSSAEAYRMRGVVALARFDAAPEERKNTDEFLGLFEGAKRDFIQCKALDPWNAGAYYNLALIALREGDLDQAIKLSEDLLAAQKEVPRKAREKYFPDLYINLACFLADKAKLATDAATQTAMHDRIAAVCMEGKKYLQDEVKSSRAMDNFRDSLNRELGSKGDFAELPRATRAALEDLLDTQTV